MNEEISSKLSSAMADILKSIEPALQKLSETLCVSIDAIRENAMSYIMMYGQYDLAKSITSGLGWTFGIFFVVLGVCSLCVIFSDGSTDEEVKHFMWKCLKIIGSLFILVLSVVEFNICLPYIMSPEMYSINAVVELVNNTVNTGV